MNLDNDTYVALTKAMLSHINVGTGEDLSIADLAQSVAKVVGYSGSVEFDLGRPDGAPRKLMDSSRLNRLGWRAEVGLDDGLARAYANYCIRNARV